MANFVLVASGISTEDFEKGYGSEDQVGWQDYIRTAGGTARRREYTGHVRLPSGSRTRRKSLTPSGSNGINPASNLGPSWYAFLLDIVVLFMRSGDASLLLSPFLNILNIR